MYHLRARYSVLVCLEAHENQNQERSKSREFLQCQWRRAFAAPFLQASFGFLRSCPFQTTPKGPCARMIRSCRKCNVLLYNLLPQHAEREKRERGRHAIPAGQAAGWATTWWQTTRRSSCICSRAWPQPRSRLFFMERMP